MRACPCGAVRCDGDRSQRTFVDAAVLIGCLSVLTDSWPQQDGCAFATNCKRVVPKCVHQSVRRLVSGWVGWLNCGRGHEVRSQG